MGRGKGGREGGKALGRNDKETTRREGERRDTCRVKGREREREAVNVFTITNVVVIIIVYI